MAKDLYATPKPEFDLADLAYAIAEVTANRRMMQLTSKVEFIDTTGSHPSSPGVCSGRIILCS